MKGILKEKTKKKGFTLIELIIVLAIMAIIAAIAIPNFTAVRDNSKTKADLQSCETIRRTVLMLVSDETVKAAAKTITFDAGGGKFNYTASAFSADEQKAIEEALAQVKKPQVSTIKSYLVTITAGGDVTVIPSTTVPS